MALDAQEGAFVLSWNQDRLVDEFLIYWETETGTEYNTSTDSNQTEFTVSDSRITSATWYYISLVAVAGEETSNRSDTLRIGTREFDIVSFVRSFVRSVVRSFARKLLFLTL